MLRKIELYNIKDMFCYLPYFGTHYVVLSFDSISDLHSKDAEVILKHLKFGKILLKTVDGYKVINRKKIPSGIYGKKTLIYKGYIYNYGYVKFKPTVKSIKFNDVEVVEFASVFNFLNNMYDGNKIYFSDYGKQYLLSYKTLNNVNNIEKTIKNRNFKYSNTDYCNYKFDAAISNNYMRVKPSKFEIFIYDVKQVGDKLEVKFLFGGYNFHEFSPKILAKNSYNIYNNEDYRVYSKHSKYFESNFYTLEIDSIKIGDKIEFTGEDCSSQKLLTTRNAGKKGKLTNDLSYEFYDNILCIISIDKPQIVVDAEKEKRNIILFQDRQNMARDNAEYLYKYFIDNNILPSYEKYFILEKESLDFCRLKDSNYEIVEFGSYEHKKLFINASYIFTSHLAKRIYSPFENDVSILSFCDAKIIFLQHGIVMGDHSGFMDRLNNNVFMMCTSVVEETNVVKKFSEYNHVIQTGLSRFDTYKKNSRQNYILYAPSWNTQYANDFINSEYYIQICKVLNSKKIIDFLEKEELYLYFMLHPEFLKFGNVFSKFESSRVKIIEDNDYKKLLSGCEMLITDYSSILWDILYMEKEVFMHQPYQLHHKNDLVTCHLQYCKRSNSIEELIENLYKYEKGNINVNSLFSTDNNSKRIVNSFLELENKVIQNNV